MAKFCTNCGKKLVDGKPCDCEKKEEKKVVETEVVMTSSSDLVNEYLEALKGIFVKPVDTMKKFTKKANLTLTVIMLLLNSIIFGLFVYLFAKESVGSALSSIYYISGRGYEVPASVFFGAFVLMIVFFFCLGGLLHLIANLMKKESDFKEIMALIGVNAVFTTVTTLVALVFMFINGWLAAIILAIAGFMFLLNLYHGFVNYTAIDKNKICYAFTVCYAITLFLVCYVLPKIFD